MRGMQSSHNCGKKLLEKLRKVEKEKTIQEQDFYNFRQDSNKFRQQLAKAFLECDTLMKSTDMINVTTDKASKNNSIEKLEY